MNQRSPILILAVFVALASLTVVSSRVAGNGEELLDPLTQPRFFNPLPIPGRIDVTGLVPADQLAIDEDLGTVEEIAREPRGSKVIRVDMRETTQALGLFDENGEPLITTVWGYGTNPNTVTSPGATFVAMRDVPVEIQWRNKLPQQYNFPNGPNAHLLPVDPKVHIAYPTGGGIPTVTHLHGGHTESASDGLPEAWFTQSFVNTGPEFVKRTYRYDNDQEAATLWYHDHALGATRLNVYAGLAGFYLLRDSNELDLIDNDILPGGPYEVEIVIQDRMFSEDGELFYPAEDPEIEPGFEPLPPGPSVIAEFFGDFILVNGAPWPKLEVEPRKYRFRFLNGSDSRFYVLEFRNSELGGAAQPFLQIGTDNGFLPVPVPLTQLLFAPGERADLIVDFSGQTEVYVRNFGPDDPFKGFNPDGSISDGDGGVAPPADPATTGQIMKFDVSLPLDGSVPDASVGLGTQLRPDIDPLTQTGATRQLVLFEGLDQYGRLQPLLGTLEEGSLAWFEPITENPMLDDVEVWEVYNATEDAHPVHLHLVSFQITGRESFEGFVEEKPQPEHDGGFGVGGVLNVTSLGGDARPPEENERGWKDTAVMLPGEVTRVIAKFDREGRYVWHCHILSHEDHEMMRPYEVLPAMAGSEESASAISLQDRALSSAPLIQFQMPSAGAAEIKIFNVLGREVRSLGNRQYGSGENQVRWDGLDNRGQAAPSGVYFFRVDGKNIQQTNRLTLLR